MDLIEAGRTLVPEILPIPMTTDIVGDDHSKIAPMKPDRFPSPPPDDGENVVANNNQCLATPQQVETDTGEGEVGGGAAVAVDNDGVRVQEGEESPALDIYISNVVSTFNSRCHLNLRRIAQEGSNVEFRRESGRVTMKLRNPTTTANMWSSGKITLTGATSEENARIAGRKFARFLQRIGFKVKFTSFRVVNVLGTCSLPFGVRLVQFTEANRKHARYEPELHPAVTYQMKKLKAVLKVFSTGSITVTAPSVLAVQTAIEALYPIVHEHKMAKPKPRNKVIKDETPLSVSACASSDDSDAQDQL